VLGGNTKTDLQTLVQTDKTMKSLKSYPCQNQCLKILNIHRISAIVEVNVVTCTWCDRVLHVILWAWVSKRWRSYCLSVSGHYMGGGPSACDDGGVWSGLERKWNFSNTVPVLI